MAAAAQREWAATAPTERARVLRRAADLLRERNRELSELETLDTGKAIQETLVADAASGADCLEYFANLIATDTTEHIPLGGAPGDSFAYTRREPLGVCVGIGAWNYPIQIACWKAAPALAAGNAMIFKPSEVTPLSALRLAEILVEAGLPPAGRTRSCRAPVRSAPRSTAIPAWPRSRSPARCRPGERVAASAATGLKHVTLELGGKSPIVVFDDADLDDAVSGAMLGNFYSTGQVCSNGTRVFVAAPGVRRVPRTVSPRGPSGSCSATRSTRRPRWGPSSARRSTTRCSAIWRDGHDEGARCVTGGGAATVDGFPDGWWVQPTVFADVTDDMTIAREEIFGPVMCVLPFDDEDEVVERANATQFGLAAGVFTRDLARGHRVIARLEAGTCWINTYNLTPIAMPFGGVKHSGIGRENGRAALDHYSQLKSVYVELGHVDAPY